MYYGDERPCEPLTKASKSTRLHQNQTMAIWVGTKSIVLLILAEISISMLAGDNSILQKATTAKTSSERAEAKEQAQIDIMAWIINKTSKNEDSTLDDSKVKDILTGKSYVESADTTSFTTKKGRYIVPYSELYKATETTPVVPTPTTKYGLSDDGTVFIGKPTDSREKCNGNVEFADGQKFTQGHFIFYEAMDGYAYEEDRYFVWDENPYGEINSWQDCWNNCIEFDMYYTNGEFIMHCYGE